MTNKCRTILIAIFTLISSTSAVSADEIKLNIDVVPAPTLDYQGNVHATHLSDNPTKLQVKKNGDNWLLPLKIGSNNLFMRIQLDLVGSPHVGYTMGDVILQEPFYEKNATFDLVLSPIKGNYDSRAVYKLYEQNIDKMTPDTLMEFYQKARFAAVKRLELLNEDWSKLHSYDVQAAYVFLRSAIKLANLIHLMPTKDVLEVNNWLKQAVSINPERVGKAIGNKEYAETVSRSVDNISHVKIYNLWAKIVEIADCSKSLPLFEQYRSVVDSYPDYKKKLFVEVTGTDLKAIDLSIAECVAKLAYKSAGDSSYVGDNSYIKGITHKQVDRLRQLHKDMDNNDKMRNAVSADLVVLESLLKKLEL